MANISNLSVYLSRMDAALLDKCWWIDKIPDTIDTVVDFGCASGNLKSMIDHLAPNKYTYIGIDNSQQMRTECSKKGIKVAASLTDVVHTIIPKNTVLVLNSVIHEILSYDDNAFEFFQKLDSYGFAYIAIRDMYLTPGIQDYGLVLASILNSPYEGRWHAFAAVARSRADLRYRNPATYTKEFLLKYWYTENWDRECKEQYLWEWKYCFDLLTGPYDIEYENDFYIPFIRNKVKQDFDYDFNVNTHKKLLLKRNDI